MSLRAAIIDWSASQPPWRRDLLRRVAVRDADDQACSEVLELLLGEHGLAPAAPTAKPIVISDLPDDSPGKAGVLHEVGDCSNVGAIDSPEPLTFEPSHVTLVYGPNGSGKSSYARIIKRVAHAAFEEPVRPDVFASASSPPRAVIDLENANGRRKHIVPLADEPRLLLDSMTVFDDRCASVYVRNEKTVEFTPTPLRIFGRAASAQRRIRTLLDERIDALAARRPATDAFPAGTDVHLLLDRLSANTPLDRVLELATLSPEEIDAHAQAKLELAAVDAGAIETQVRQRERDASALDVLAADLDAASRVVGPEAEARVRGAREMVGEAEKAVALSRSTALGDEPSTTGTPGWRRMWEAARSFVEDDCEHVFPPTEHAAVCPLCRQELHHDARLRLQRLDDFVRSTLERELETARTTLTGALGVLESSGVDRALGSPGLMLLQDERPELAAAAQTWLETAAARAVALHDGREAPELPASQAVAVRELAAVRRQEAAHQRSLVDPQKLNALRRQVAEGDARALLRDRLSEISEWHATLGTIAALERVRKELDTTALSHKQTELAKGLVTDVLRAAVREELDALGFRHLKVDLSCRTDRGTTVARMQLGNGSAPVVDVLSAGEQRACALAFFLAEARTSASAGGLVFDDPSSAFDVERLEHVARRIVELAEKRQQVIVFSCDIVFCWCLQAAADARGIGLAVRPIARVAERVGIVRADQPWPGESLKIRRGRLRATLQELEALERKGEIDEYERRAKAFAGDIREAWERAIEEELFRGVVMRFQRDIKASKMRDVIVTEEATRELLDAMNEVSAYHHEAALAKPVPTPSSQQLRRFLERLETFCEGLKKKRKKEDAASSPKVA